MSDEVPAIGGVQEALRDLGSFAARLTWDGLTPGVQDRTLLVLYDTLGVAAAGAKTPEVGSFASRWAEEGTVPLVGLRRTAGIEPSIWINAMSICSLELDEGSKFARGHPAGHVLPAALALGFETVSSGAEWLGAFLAGYEIAARHGRATRLHSGVHPHGNWGSTGAAAAGARLFGLDAEQIAAALDAAAGLVLAAPFESAFTGNLIRNVWMGAAGAAGVVAARMAAAGLARVDDTADHSLGRILGSLTVEELTTDLDARFEISSGYFKRHAACAYTHPAADACEMLREPWEAEDITSVDVETYRIAATLNRIEWPSRLAAMFSIPYVVAVMLLDGSFGPAATDAARRADPKVRAVAEKVTVRATEAFETRLPERRGARVTAHLADGTTRSAEVENPIGDATFHPLGWPQIRSKLQALIGASASGRLEEIVRALPEASRVHDPLSALREV
jgi:2-methylcitrate dehydratase PrpD